MSRASDSDIDREESDTSESSESPIDDTYNDPTYKGRCTVVQANRKTRYRTQLNQVYPNKSDKNAKMPKGDDQQGGVAGGR